MPAWRLSRRFGSVMALMALVGGIYAAGIGVSGAGAQAEGAGTQPITEGSVVTDGWDWS
ncbi:hypothetical protein GCM10027290_10950 [Micromonospora sonneratiae]|uniref:Endoglucanase n=1 Tax=Micromonospora sonneratiae TaxID=1184706 RepID=A0ABW3YHI0_9ACTN